MAKSNIFRRLVRWFTKSRNNSAGRPPVAPRTSSKARISQPTLRQNIIRNSINGVQKTPIKSQQPMFQQNALSAIISGNKSVDAYNRAIQKGKIPKSAPSKASDAYKKAAQRKQSSWVDSYKASQKKGMTGNEMLLIENISRMPVKLQKKAYKNNAALAKKVAKQTEKSAKKNPALYAFSEAMSPVPLEQHMQNVTGRKIDTSKTKKTLPYKAGYGAGLLGSFITGGGAAEGAVATSLKQAAKQGGKQAVKTAAKGGKKALSKSAQRKIAEEIIDFGGSKTAAKIAAKNIVKSGSKSGKEKAVDFGARRAADAIVSAPMNLAEAGKTGIDDNGKLNKKKAAKDFAANTALDIAFGGVLDKGISSIAKKGEKNALANNLKIMQNESTERARLVLQKATPQQKKAAIRALVRDGGDTTKFDNIIRRIEAKNKPLGTLKVVEQANAQPQVKTTPQATVQAPDVKQQATADIPERVQEPQSIEQITRSKISANSKQQKTPAMEKIKDASDYTYRKLVDSKDAINKIAKNYDNDQLIASANMAGGSGKIGEHNLGVNQTDFYGRNVGKALKDIFNPVMAKGSDYYNSFQDYLYNLHNIDRMREGKPVFGDGATADMSRQHAQELLAKYPEFKTHASEVRKYLNNLQQRRVDSGLLSPEQKTLMDDMFENYVPTYRRTPKTAGISSSKSGVEVNNIKQAKGSDLELLPLHEQMARMTMDTIKAGETNKLINDIVNTTGLKVDSSGKVDPEAMEDILSGMATADKQGKVYTMKGYNNGVPYTAEIDKPLYDALQSLVSKEPTENELMNSFLNVANKGNSVFKSAITSWNPFFVVKNMARDIQDTILYSQNLASTVSQVPKAITQMATNGPMWQLYKSMGGINSSFFDNAAGFKRDSGWLKKNTLDRIEDVNMYTEQFPRFAEFLGYIKKNGGDIKNIDELASPKGRNLMEQAMLAAADVTVNFGRSGSAGKVLNQSFVPFFNPAMQGFDKLVRTLKGTKGVKGWGNLVFKTAMFGMAPSLLNEMLLGDDEGYQAISDREKDTNYIFKLADGQFIKIPKGRVMSMLSSPIQRGARTAMTGEDFGFADYAKTALDQVGPINPIESNILAPIAAVGRNETWYGTPIESGAMEGLPTGERADASTTTLSKAIGEKTGASPKKLDYLLDAYTGVIGDVAMPLMTPQAGRADNKLLEPAAKAFTIDSTLQNKYSTQFYDQLEKAEQAKNSSKATSSDESKYKALNSYSSRVAEVNNALREVQNSDIDNETKRMKVRTLTAARNVLMRNAIDGKKLTEQRNDTDAIKTVMGARWVLQNRSESVLKKADSYVKNGGSYDKFYEGQKGMDTMTKKADSTATIYKAMGLAQAGADDKLYKINKADRMKNVAKGLIDTGISPDKISKMYKEVKGGGSYNSKDKVKAYLDKTDYGREEKSLLFRALCSSWNAANPYGDVVAYNKSSGKGGYRSSGRRYSGRRSGRSSGRRSSGSSSRSALSDADKKFQQYADNQLRSLQTAKSSKTAKTKTSMTKAQRKALFKLMLKEYM